MNQPIMKSMFAYLIRLSYIHLTLQHVSAGFGFISHRTTASQQLIINRQEEVDTQQPLYLNHKLITTTLFAQTNNVINNNNKSHSTTDNSSSSSSSPSPVTKQTKFQHILAVLTIPQTSQDRIANEAILETCIRHTNQKLSIVLRCQDNKTLPKLNELRGYVGEVYSLAWDCALGFDSSSIITTTTNNNNNNPDLISKLLDVIVYPQNLPNAAPEQWIHHRPDLDCICSHDSIIGWVSSSQSGTGFKFSTVEGSGIGGLDAHVDAVNEDRRNRGLGDVKALHAENWPDACFGGVCGIDDDVVFLEDYDAGDNRIEEQNLNQRGQDGDKYGGLIGGGYRIPSSSLFSSVAVGGTFDGMHYGHRKLLTLAVSSVLPNSGKLLVGITTDEMLQSKKYAELIPSLNERIKGVRDFIETLAPGIKNQLKIVPIKDAYGPPGAASDSDVYSGIVNDFDALVLSHETLPTGKKLNDYRVDKLKMKPLKLLCTRRTESHNMSSTALRRMKKSNETLREKLT